MRAAGIAHPLLVDAHNSRPDADGRLQGALARDDSCHVTPNHEGFEPYDLVKVENGE